MSIPRTVRSSTLVTQALISGVVRDRLTGGPPRMPVDVRLTDRDAGEDFPLQKRVFEDGRFAFYGQPEQAFPLLAQETYQLRLLASASNYGSATLDIDIGPEPDQPALVSVTVEHDGIEDMQVRLFTGVGLPQRELVLEIDRTPVEITGRIHESQEHAEPVPGALVSVADISAESDTDGRFHLPNPLPVVQSVEVQVTADGFEPAVFDYEPDYTRPVNFLQIALVRES
jgi:hypothetical protein